MRLSRSTGRWVSGSRVLRWWGIEVVGVWGLRAVGFSSESPIPYYPNTSTPQNGLKNGDTALDV